MAAPDFAVGYFSSPLDVRVASTAGPGSYFVNVGVSGVIAASRDGLDATLDTATARVVNPGDSQELRPTAHPTPARFLGLHIDAALVDQQYAALAGAPPSSTVRLDFTLDLARREGHAVHLLVHSLVELLDSGDPLFRRAELQRSQVACIVTALLLAQPHSHTAALRHGPPPAHPRALRIALAFVEAHLAERITLGRFADGYRARFNELPSTTATRR
ncbi:hypothetical protein AB0C93_26605 [Streptomyces sp. NPDC048518]|uniref:AraC-like ligand-binding domain-containing protein n=1 Tax=Streptomyces sp. NPDC048518 TaxID=3155029 RepID=UPI0033C80FE1